MKVSDAGWQSPAERAPGARRNQRLPEEAQPVVASVHSEECQSLLSS